MSYVIKLLTFLDAHGAIVIGALFGALALFGVVNWLSNPYRKQNKKIAFCTRNIRSFPAKVALFAASLPAEYRRQWRAFVNCGIDKPALVFEFAPLRKRVSALWLLIAASLVASTYIAVFVLVHRSLVYIVMQVVFWLSFALILIINKAIFKRNTRHAKQIFAQFVTQLSASTPKSHTTVVEDTVKALNKLNKGEVNDETVGKAGEILHCKGLSEDRTVEEQRRVNLALNGLLQAYAKNAQHKPI